jgi:hypothetical protein
MECGLLQECRGNERAEPLPLFGVIGVLGSLDRKARM